MHSMTSANLYGIGVTSKIRTSFNKMQQLQFLQEIFKYIILYNISGPKKIIKYPLPSLKRKLADHFRDVNIFFFNSVCPEKLGDEKNTEKMT